MKRIIILSSVIAVVVVLYSVAWVVGAGFVSSQVTALASADGETNPRVTCGELHVTGFPFAFDVACETASVTSGDIDLGLGGLRASVMVYSPFHVLISARSPLTVEDAFTGSRSRVDFDSASASARLTNWRIGRVSLVVEKPVWNDVILEDRLIASASHLEAHLIDLPEKYDAAAGLSALGEYVQVDDLAVTGQSIAGGKATLEAQILNLPADVRQWGEGDLLRRWQQSGGQFLLTKLVGGDDKGSFDITGNLNLDDQGKLGGQFRLSSKGIVERFEAEVPAEVRGLVLGSKDAEGTTTQTINIAGGVILSGVVPMAMVPPLW